MLTIRMWCFGCGFLCQYHMAILCLMFLRWEGRNCQPQTEKLPGFKIEAPAEVTVQRGLCVLVPCKFIVGPGFTVTRDAIGIWFKGTESGIVATSTNASQFPDTTNGRFIFTGKVSAGDCSFSISDAQPGDDARYQFRVEDGRPIRFYYTAVQPTVSVTDLKRPDISPMKTLRADEEVTLTCTAPTNCPGLSPTFTWEGSVNTERTKMYKLPQQDGNVIYSSNITFTPSPRHHKTSLTCTVTYKRESTKKTITLKVDYLNKPEIFPTKKLIAGEQVTLNFSSFGNCMDNSPDIAWDGNINITNIENDWMLHPSRHVTYLSYMTFTPSQTDHNTSLTCTVTCKGISTKQSIILDVGTNRESCLDPIVIPAVVAGNICILSLMGLGICWYNKGTRAVQEKDNKASATIGGTRASSIEEESIYQNI
uniref:Ig-like domain-containing protein n=1 Tax=Xenopus tropicalis TaxID=8364 RepID=L7N3E4_XENTR